MTKSKDDARSQGEVAPRTSDTTEQPDLRLGISHPADEPLVILRQSYRVLCEGDQCAACILSIFEYWTKVRIRGYYQDLDKAQADPDLKPLFDPWIYKTYEAIGKDLQGLFSRNRIHTALMYLRTKGFVEARFNPKNPFDQTTQYKLVAKNIKNPGNVDSPVQDDGESPTGPLHSPVQDPVYKEAEITTEITSTERTTPPTPVSENPELKTNTPITDQTAKCLRRLERDKHFGKLSTPQRRQLLEAIQKLSYSEEEVLAAMEAFLGVDYWHEHSYKVGSFLNFLRGEAWRESYTVALPTNPTRPVIAEAREVPNQPPPPTAPTLAPPIAKSYKCRWNEVFPDRPAGPVRASVELAIQAESQYVESFDKILSKARAIVDGSQDHAPWLQYSWLFRSQKETGEPNWWRILSGSLDGMGKSDVRPERDTTASVARRMLEKFRKEQGDAGQNKSDGV